MSERQWEAIDDYLCNKTQAHDDALEAALAMSDAEGLPSIAVAPNQGKLLYLLAKLRGARRILEIGTLGGYSTIWLARALPADGTLISLEAEPHHAQVARKNIDRAGLSRVASVVVGPALETLERFVRENVEAFDFVFIDADKKTYPDYLRLSTGLSRPGTVIMGDNVIRRGRIADEATTDPDVLGVRAFFDMLSADTRLSSTAVQTVGSKGWDGFSLTIVGE